MKIYPEDYEVAVTVPFTDRNGQAVTPVEVRAALYDADDLEIVDFGSLPFDAEEKQKEIIVPGAFHILGTGEISSLRVLRIQLVTAAGVIRLSHSYLIEGEFRLVPMVNSFQTYEAADFAARDIPNLSGWTVSNFDRRCAALIEAFNRLTRIPMKFDTTEVSDYQNRDNFESYGDETVITRAAWPIVTADEFNTFPLYFRKALKAAQLVEANEILQGDAVAKKRRSGIISETIGESSVMLRGGVLDTGVASPTLKILNGMIYRNHRTVRA